MNELIVYQSGKCSMIGVANEAKCRALINSSDISEVRNDEQHAAAVASLTELHTIIAEVEDSRVALNAPILEARRVINDSAKEFVAKLILERERISAIDGEYLAVQLARQRSEQAARTEGLTALEKQREEALSKAQTLEERDAIHQDFSDALSTLPSVAPIAEKTAPDIEFDVTDIRALYLSFPNLVELKPKRRDIKDALKAGTSLPGVKVSETVSTKVRRTKEKVIDV